MPPPTSAATHYELIGTAGQKIPVMIRRPSGGAPVAVGDPDLPTIHEALQAATADEPVSNAQLTTVQETWIGGIGVPGIGYNIAPGVYTQTDGVAMSAGAVTQSPVPGGVGFSSSPIVAFEEFAGQFFALQQGAAAGYGGRILRSSDGTGVGAGAFAGVTMADYGGTPTYLPVGEYMHDLCIFDNGAGTRYLYASSSDINGLNGRLHRTSDGVTWHSTPAARFGPYGRRRMKAVHWRTNDGISGWRLVTISADQQISYSIPDADPFLADSWVEGVKVFTNYSLLDMAAAKTHVWLSARDNLFDITEQGDTPGLLSDTAMPPHGANGVACLYLDNWVYQTVGDGSVHRIWVGDGPVVQEQSGVCGPGYRTPARSDWLAGYTTAMCGGLDGILTASYNPLTQRTGIFVGIDKRNYEINIPTANPLIWHGPMFTVNADYRITRMRISTLANDRRLWQAAQSASTLFPIIIWGSLPEVGAPLDVLLSDGLHRYNSEIGTGILSPFSRIEMLLDSFGDANATHIVNDISIASEGFGSGTGVNVYQRVDPAPRSTAWGSAVAASISPTQTINPLTESKGQRIQTRIDFINPNGRSTPAVVGVLDAVRITRWDAVPTSDVKVLDVEYGDGVKTLGGGDWNKLDLSPDTVTEWLLDLVEFGRTIARDPWGNTVTLKVLQSLNRDVTITTGDWRKKVRAQLRVEIVGDAA